MFRNSGRKIRVLAVILTILGALAACAGGVWFYLKAEVSWIDDDGVKVLLAAGMALAGALVFWLFMLPLYAYGQMTDCLEDMADANEEMNRKMTELIDRVEHLPVLRMGSGTVSNGEKVPAKAESARAAKPILEEKPKNEKRSAPKKETEKTEEPAAREEPVKEPAAEEKNANPQQTVIDNGVWKCPDCGNLNPSESNKCVSCGASGLWQCRHCGKVSPYNIDVCPECGTVDVRRCRKCGCENRRNALRCGKCGAAL